MIPQKEIQRLAETWGVPPDTVDKDYVLGHFLAGFNKVFSDRLVFKGGTCLRKCYFPDYRFSEDLDFTSRQEGFELKETDLELICQKVEQHGGILFSPKKMVLLRHNDETKGYQIKISYWGANHSKNQQPPPSERWLSRIKVEVSTDEVLLQPNNSRQIHHPYSDSLLGSAKIPCYGLLEVIAEKLRSLIQRSYTAPRDYYDLYHLTNDFDKKNWAQVKALFLDKMEHKNFIYAGPGQLVSESSVGRVKKSWDASIAHQVNELPNISKDEMIDQVVRRIMENL